MSEAIEGVVLPPGTAVVPVPPPPPPPPVIEGLPAPGEPPQLPAPPEAPKPEKPKRRRSGTAAWHMSDEAVDISLSDVYRMTDTEALEYLVKARWGARTSVRCPHCGTVAGHYWRPQQQRWKCRGCRKAFSVTSNTVFSGHKLPLQDLIAGTLMFVNSSGGQPALELKRHWNTTYNTAYVLQHKLREALVRGYNVGLLAGDLEMDGSHQSGHNAAGRRGQPQGGPRKPDKPTTEKDKEDLLKTSNEKQAEREEKKKQRKEGAFQPEHGMRATSPDRRIVLSVRKRSNVRGAGAIESRVAVGLAESDESIGAMMGDFVACSESYLNTDEAPVYAGFAEKFIGHAHVRHSETFSGPNGETNNFAEELNARLERAERGIYLNVEPKYLLDYACEVAFRCDTRRMSNGRQLKLVLNRALNVGTSRFWKGFSQGRHRTHELTHPQPRLAKASGPQKGRNPISSKNGRPPR